MRRVTESDPVTLEELGRMAIRRIELRPSFGNRSRNVDDPATRQAIAGLVERVVRR